MSSIDIPRMLAVLIPLVLSLSVHEFAHAWSAHRLGDDTASRMGRMTLNPIAHIDVLGTLLLPAYLMLSGAGFVFGWAKPVPVDPRRFRRDVNMGSGMAWTAAAGPISNLVLALLTAIVLGLLIRFAPEVLQNGGGARELIGSLIGLNVILALFNLIPVPPLDGSRIVDGYLPYRLRPAWERVTAVAPFLLVGVFIFGGRLIAGPASFVASLFYRLALSIGVS